MNWIPKYVLNHKKTKRYIKDINLSKYTRISNHVLLHVEVILDCEGADLYLLGPHEQSTAVRASEQLVAIDLAIAVAYGLVQLEAHPVSIPKALYLANVFDLTTALEDVSCLASLTDVQQGCLLFLVVCHELLWLAEVWIFSRHLLLELPERVITLIVVLI